MKKCKNKNHEYGFDSDPKVKPDLPIENSGPKVTITRIPPSLPPILSVEYLNNINFFTSSLSVDQPKANTDCAVTVGGSSYASVIISQDHLKEWCQGVLEMLG